MATNRAANTDSIDTKINGDDSNMKSSYANV
jgi:hypothetical protein